MLTATPVPAHTNGVNGAYGAEGAHATNGTNGTNGVHSTNGDSCPVKHGAGDVTTAEKTLPTVQRAPTLEAKKSEEDARVSEKPKAREGTPVTDKQSKVEKAKKHDESAALPPLDRSGGSGGKDESPFTKFAQLIQAAKRPLPTQTGDGSYITKKAQASLLGDLKTLGLSDFKTLKDLRASKHTGDGRADDKTYLMERIIQVRY